MPDLVQRLLAVVLLAVLSPLTVALAIAVRLDSPGPAVFRARRIGRHGREFVCYKLRTMVWAPGEAGSAITVAADPRVTRLGRFLRAFRLDELPQLFNVVRGDIRLVGPRPEEPRYVDLSDPLHKVVFTATPGLTGLAQLFYLDEAELLHGPDAERTYRSDVLPRKLALDARYLRNRSTILDLRILAATAAALAGRKASIDLLDRWAPLGPDGAVSTGGKTGRRSV